MCVGGCGGGANVALFQRTQQISQKLSPALACEETGNQGNTGECVGSAVSEPKTPEWKQHLDDRIHSMPWRCQSTVIPIAAEMGKQCPLGMGSIV